jgi:hypothetical protein
MEVSELTKSGSAWDEDQFALYLGTLQHLVRFDHVIQGDSCSDYRWTSPWSIRRPG